MALRRLPKRFAMIAAAVASLLAPQALRAQGCAMCYAGAAAQSEKGIHALNLGILMLLLPAVAIFGGIFWMAYRHRDTWAGSSSE